MTKKKLDHYLMSLHCPCGCGYYLHTYFMTTSPKKTSMIIFRKMLDMAEDDLEDDVSPLLRRIKLNEESIAIVREIICEVFDDARAKLARAKDFYAAMFMVGDIDNRQLLELGPCPNLPAAAGPAVQ